LFANVAAHMASLRKHTLDLTPLKVSKDFRLLWSGLTVSAVGSMLTRVAVPLQVYDLTHSSWKVGLTGAISLVPVLLASIFGGAVADISDRRRMLLRSLLVGALLSAGLALNASSTTRLWLLYLLAATMGANGAFSAPASRSAVPALVTPDLIPAAQALQMLTYTGAGVLAPAIGGLLYRSIGPAWTYAVDGVSYGACFIAVLGMRKIPVGNPDERFHPRLVLDGFRSLKGRHAVQGSFAADLIAMVFGMPMALFPAIAAQRFAGHPKLVGLLYAALPFGAMLATVFSGWTRTVHRHGRVIVMSVVVWGFAITGLGLIHSITLSLILLAISGAADAVSGVSRMAMLQLATPDNLQGRMQGVGMAVWITGPYLGDFEAGGVAALTSVDTSILLGGIACVVCILGLAKALPAFSRFDSLHQESSAERTPVTANVE
jgi:MFS family permease